MSKKTKQDEGQMVMHHASELAQVIAKYISSQKEIHKYGMTTVAYAVEMLLSTPFQNDMRMYDKESAEFRRFLSVVHEDVKALIYNAKMVN